MRRKLKKRSYYTKASPVKIISINGEEKILPAYDEKRYYQLVQIPYGKEQNL